jgi:hypothetical protein
MFWKWLAFGITVASAIAGGLFLPATRNFAFRMLFLGLFVSSIICGVTNFGKGYWTQAGWSHSQRQPWSIPPVRRPRLGGFALGFVATAYCVIVAILIIKLPA